MCERNSVLVHRGCKGSSLFQGGESEREPRFVGLFFGIKSGRDFSFGYQNGRVCGCVCGFLCESDREWVSVCVREGQNGRAFVRENRPGCREREFM